MTAIEMFRAAMAVITGFLFGRLQDARGFAPRSIYAGLLLSALVLLIISFIARTKP